MVLGDINSWRAMTFYTTTNQLSDCARCDLNYYKNFWPDLLAVEIQTPYETVHAEPFLPPCAQGCGRDHLGSNPLPRVGISLARPCSHSPNVASTDPRKTKPSGTTRCAGIRSDPANFRQVLPWHMREREIPKNLTEASKILASRAQRGATSSGGQVALVTRSRL